MGRMGAPWHVLGGGSPAPRECPSSQHPTPCWSVPHPLLLRSASFHVVREALKWKAKDAEAVDALHATAPDLVKVYRQLMGQPDGVPGALHRLACWWKVGLGARCG